MKKVLAMILTLTLVFAFAACGSGSTTETNENNGTGIAGGWTRADSPVITEEQAAIFEKALEGLTGADYEAVAYLASQVVAGTNHLFLVRVKPVVPDPVEKYALVSIYEDLDGNAEILEVIDSDIETNINGMMGGWQAAESPVVPEDVAEALMTAKEGLTGADFEPVALAGTQLVSGKNYMILCESTIAPIEPERSYAMITLYIDLQGNAEITDSPAFGVTE